jgi:hypothetical protein
MRSRSEAGDWGPVVAVSPPGQAPSNPQIALDDDGDAVVVWDAFDGTNYLTYARRVSKTGTLGPVEVLSGTEGESNDTDVAVDADGDAVVTWAERQEDGSVIPKMRPFAKDGTLQPEVVLSSNPARAETPDVAIDREGDAVIAWTNGWVVQARTLTASGTLGELETVSPEVSVLDDHSRARAIVDRDGDTLVTWMHRTEADGSQQVWGRWMSRDGTVGDVRQLTPSAHASLSNYSVAGGVDGDVLVTWDRFPTPELYALRLTTGSATVGEPGLVSSYGRLHSVAVDDDGDGVVVWQGEGINHSVGSIRARRVTKAGAFATEQLVEPTGEMPKVAVSPTGGALLAWERRFQVDLMVVASVGL